MRSAMWESMAVRRRREQGRHQTSRWSTQVVGHFNLTVNMPVYDSIKIESKRCLPYRFDSGICLVYMVVHWQTLYEIVPP